MKYRKLRIAWSVGWRIVAVLLCVLWVRSYWWADISFLNVTAGSKTYAGFESDEGRIRLSVFELLSARNLRKWQSVTNQIARRIRALDAKLERAEGRATVDHI